ncbi:hypothetical protein NMY22_g13876 [Coprinellus aureogranulatus]|nr:hypothetical protein NMY22_g13876 [Coprinellus aureogranulatus]
MASLYFCSECNNLLYPKGDPQRRQLAYSCRICQYEEVVENKCVYRNDLLTVTKEQAGVTTDLGSDPTLAHSNIPCPACGNEDETGTWTWMEEGERRVYSRRDEEAQWLEKEPATHQTVGTPQARTRGRSLDRLRNTYWSPQRTKSFVHKHSCGTASLALSLPAITQQRAPEQDVNTRLATPPSLSPSLFLKTFGTHTDALRIGFVQRQPSACCTSYRLQYHGQREVSAAILVPIGLRILRPDHTNQRSTTFSRHPYTPRLHFTSSQIPSFQILSILDQTTYGNPIHEYPAHAKLPRANTETTHTQLRGPAPTTLLKVPWHRSFIHFPSTLATFWQHSPYQPRSNTKLQAPIIRSCKSPRHAWSTTEIVPNPRTEAPSFGL